MDLPGPAINTIVQRFRRVTNHFASIKIKRAPLVQRNPTLPISLLQLLANSDRIDDLGRVCARLGGQFSASYYMSELLTTSSSRYSSTNTRHTRNIPAR